MPEGVSKFKNITLNPYQTRFVDSMARYPALIGGVGTGKTFTAILRSVRLCELYPKNKGLIVRKDYTKLKDSTMADFMDCTGMKINSKHDVEFPNGSILMFRHASELDMLKNMNLGFFYIEQAEEFETD
jgi:phage terminase large subunit